MCQLSPASQRKTRFGTRGVTLVEITIALAIASVLAMGSTAALNTFSYKFFTKAGTDSPFESFRAMAFMTRAVQLASYAETDLDNQGFSIRLDYQWLNNVWQHNGTLDQTDDTWMRVRWVGGQLHYVILLNSQPLMPDLGAAVVTDLPAANVSFTMVNPDLVGSSSTLRLSMTLGGDPTSARTLSTDVLAMRMSA